jgi:hypothetical protein
MENMKRVMGKILINLSPRNMILQGVSALTTAQSYARVPDGDSKERKIWTRFSHAGFAFVLGQRDNIRRALTGLAHSPTRLISWMNSFVF